MQAEAMVPCLDIMCLALEHVKMPVWYIRKAEKYVLYV